jgi:hypothetical protein
MADAIPLPATVMGYHGTETGLALEILRAGFNPSVGQELWLGDGCYFFDDLEYTKWWCPNNQRYRGKSIRYLRATVIYGKVLNLSPVIIESLRRFAEILENRSDLERFLGEHNATKLTLAVTINMYCNYVRRKTGREPDTVRNSRTQIINRVYPFPRAKFWTGGTAVAENTVCVRPHARHSHIQDVCLIS